MATKQKQPLSTEQLGQIKAGLELLLKSLERSKNSAKDGTIKAAYEKSAAGVSQTLNQLVQGELDL